MSYGLAAKHNWWALPLNAHQHHSVISVLACGQHSQDGPIVIPGKDSWLCLVELVSPQLS